MFRAILRRFYPRLEKLPATTQPATNLLLQAKLEVAVIQLVSQAENFVARLAKPLLVRCQLLGAMHWDSFPVQAIRLPTQLQPEMDSPVLPVRARQYSRCPDPCAFFPEKLV